MWTNNLNNVLKVARGVKSGFVMVNKFAAPSVVEPFGGYKQSGLGRESGKEGFLAYLETKTITISG